MAKKTFLVDIDLVLNQLLQARLENLAASPTGSPGRVYWNTVDHMVYQYDGTTWQALVNSGDSRMTNARTPTSHVLATNTALGAEQTISGATAGHVLRASAATAANFQQLSHTELSNIGTNTHAQIDTFIGTTAPATYAPISKGVTGGDTHDHNGGDGAQINHTSLSNIGTNSHAVIDTHIADATKHRIINDASTITTELFSASKILSLIAAVNTTVAGALIYKGSYDAATNNPLLDATPIAGIKTGWTYVVTVNGTFFAEDVQAGDMIIAKQDTPTLAAHWTVVNKNIPDIVAASETVQGIIEIATTAEVTTGTDDTRAITPLKLKQALGTSGTLSAVRKFVATIGDAVALSYTVTHNLNTANTNCSISRTGTPFDAVECEIIDTSVNTTTFNFNVAPTAAQYTATIMG